MSVDMTNVNSTTGPVGVNNTKVSQLAAQRRAILQAFRKNTRKRRQQWNFNWTSCAPQATPSAVSPQVGLWSRAWVQVRLDVQDTAASPGLTKNFRGPFNFVKRIQLVTNLGSNNIWDTDGWNCHYNNLTKSVSNVRYDQNVDSGYDNVAGTTDYTNDPWFQYPTIATQNVHYNVTFSLRLDLTPNPGMNFTQGLLNLQAPQVQASINGIMGAVADLYGNPNADTVNITGAANIQYEYFEIPNPLRRVQLPSGMLHMTMQQNTPITGTGYTYYQIPRQGILLRLQQETVLNSVWASGGPVGAAGNPGTAGIDSFLLQLQAGADTIWTENWELRKQVMVEEFPALQNFKGMTLFEQFGAFGIDEPCRGDFRDAIDTEAVTTTQFITNVNGSATLGASAFVNSTREILVPFNTQAAGMQVA